MLKLINKKVPKETTFGCLENGDTFESLDGNCHIKITVTKSYCIEDKFIHKHEESERVIPRDATITFE